MGCGKYDSVTACCMSNMHAVSTSESTCALLCDSMTQVDDANFRIARLQGGKDFFGEMLCSVLNVGRALPVMTSALEGRKEFGQKEDEVREVV